MTRRGVAIGAVLLFLVVCGSYFLVPRFLTGENAKTYLRSDAENDLGRVRNSVDELRAFNRIAKQTRVTFALFDSKDEQLGVSTSDWPNRAHRIRFLQFGDPPIDHTIIDSQNVFALMNE